MGKVRLVGTTVPEIEGLTTAEDLIIYCARVSNPSNQLNVETGDKLLAYCVKHKHWSVFQQADMTVEIKTSRAIAAQILRHRTASFQEFSQRYSSVQEFEEIELRKQGKTNRQVGDEVINPRITDFIEGRDINADDVINYTIKHSVHTYNQLIDAGVARECARMVLPLCTQTTMYMKNSVREWIHYIDLRTKEDTQKEHREIAEEIKVIFVKKFPLTSKALGWE